MNKREMGYTDYTIKLNIDVSKPLEGPGFKGKEPSGNYR